MPTVKMQKEKIEYKNIKIWKKDYYFLNDLRVKKIRKVLSKDKLYVPFAEIFHEVLDTFKKYP